MGWNPLSIANENISSHSIYNSAIAQRSKQQLQHYLK